MAPPPVGSSRSRSWAILLGAAFYLHAITVGWIGFDHGLPGSGPTQDIAFFANVALLFGGLLFVVAAATRRTASALSTPLIPLTGFAAVLYAAARFRSFDEYRFPSLVQIVDIANVPSWWLGLLAAIALLAGLVAWRRPRPGLVFEGLVLWAVLVWLFFVGPWH